jgi:transglutaminase-like putative cysteine protease
MRISVRHETVYTYDTPASWVIQTLRLAPRGYASQSVSHWNVEVDQDCRVSTDNDAFGNILHSFTVDGPVGNLTIVGSGEVETSDGSGIVEGQIERFPPMLFLRETLLTEPDDSIRALSEIAHAKGGDEPVATMHALMNAIREAMRFDVQATDVTTTAKEALALGHGVCQDFAHVFVSAARLLGYPSRYVSGYLFKSDAPPEQEAGHGWAESHLPDLGWVGFDATNAVCPTEAYVRVAVGLDYLGAAPVRGSRHGGAGEHLKVQVSVRDAGLRLR